MRWKLLDFMLAFFLFVVGVFVGRVFFPLEVEKFVEFPFYILVEQTVERRVEVPVERIVYVSERAKDKSGASAFLLAPEKLAMWSQIKVGMTRKEVVDILGSPTAVDHGRSDGGIVVGPNGSLYRRWVWNTGGAVWFYSGGDGRVAKVDVPEN